MSRRRTWHAQLLIVAGLGLTFALPYLTVSALAAQRDRQWARSGLSAYEADEWRDNGFGDANDAIQWRNVRFQAPGAHLWKQEGWNDGAEAAGWRDAGFWAREARRWRDQGFAAWEAQPWDEAGFQPEDARRWKNAEVSPSVAAARRKQGEEPGRNQ